MAVSATCLFDPTHGTNVYDFSLCIFTSVGEHGQSVMLAFAVIKSQSVEYFLWAFKCFHACFKVSPFSIFTDRDANIVTALAKLRGEGA